MAKKVIKIFLLSIMMLFILILYGGFIGGDIGVIQFIVLTVLSLFLIVIYFGERITEKSIASVLFMSIIISALGSGVYYWINTAFDNQAPTKQYQIQIIDLPEGRNIDDGFYYRDKNGDEIYYSEFRIIPFDFEVGDKVEVKEFNGTFGVKHYKFSKIS